MVDVPDKSAKPQREFRGEAQGSAGVLVDPSQVLELFCARVALGTDARTASARESPEPNSPPPQWPEASSESFPIAGVECTPTPMVLGSNTESLLLPAVKRACCRSYPDEDAIPTPPEPHSQRRRAGSLPSVPDAEQPPSASVLATDRAIAEPVERPRYSYHPPKTPPGMLPPTPIIRERISVVPECDPHAPTRPRMRRGSSLPPPPTAGRERMLLLGLVMGGLFVAVMVLVQQLWPDAGTLKTPVAPLGSRATLTLPNAVAPQPMRTTAPPVTTTPAVGVVESPSPGSLPSIPLKRVAPAPGGTVSRPSMLPLSSDPPAARSGFLTEPSASAEAPQRRRDPWIE